MVGEEKTKEKWLMVELSIAKKRAFGTLLFSKNKK